MINFNSKFDLKASNIGFFVSNDLKFKSDKSIPQSISLKINSFLKKQPIKEEKTNLFFRHIRKSKMFFNKIKNLDTYEINSLGAALKVNLKSDKNIKNICILANSVSDEIITEFAYGYELKSYTFNKYKSKNNDIDQSINFTVKNDKLLKSKYKNYSSVKEGVFLARDLVSEPPNVLNPKKYTEEISKLKKLGLKVEILNEKHMKKLGMNSLLGVGQGSENDSFMVIIKWNGAKSNFGSKTFSFCWKRSLL